LKKRTKKLLLMAAGMHAHALSHLPDAICKSFLLLFFKKEVLSLFYAATPACGGGTAIPAWA
jgi:hypothetical protein